MAKKTTASDLEVGEIHKKVTKIINGVADSVLRNMEQLREMDPTTDLSMVVNMRDITVMMAWCEKNEVRAHTILDDETTSASQKLKAIKQAAASNVLKFRDTDDDIQPPAVKRG